MPPSFVSVIWNANGGETLLGPASIIYSACNACCHCRICSTADWPESIHLMQCAVTAPSDPAANLVIFCGSSAVSAWCHLIPLSISKLVHCPNLPACNWRWVLHADHRFDALWCPLPPLWSFQLYIPTPYSARPYLRALPSNPTALSRSVLFAEIAVHTYLNTCQCLDALPGNPCAPVYLALIGSTVLTWSF